MTRRKYGWRPDLPKPTMMETSCRFMKPYALKGDLLPHCPPVLDQGELGSCTANAWESGLRIRDSLTFNLIPDVFSRLFIYYNERKLEGTIPYDAGARISDGAEVLQRYGVCFESDWPYDTINFPDVPSDKCYADALGFQLIERAPVPVSGSQFAAQIELGCPIVFGFTVFPSFESAEMKTGGVLKLPSRSESPIGGHAVVAVGWNLTEEWILVRNSWGADWGLNGYFKMPFAYLQRYASDAQAIQKVEFTKETIAKLLHKRADNIVTA